MKNRILCINNSSKVGLGTSTVLLQIAKYLHNEFDIAVASDRHSPQLAYALGLYRIPHHALPDRVVHYLPALIRVILQGKFDLIYANGSNERSRGAFWAAKITRKPLIWHIHESVRKITYARTFRFADAVIANSEDTAERLRQVARVADPLVIRNGVDLQIFERDRLQSREFLANELGINREWVRVINMGRIGHDKNQLNFIDVASLVLTRFPQTYFILVGVVQEPDYLEQLKCVIRQRNLTRNILLSDYTPDVGDYMCGCDLMLHTAQKEPQGLVILEAMAAKLPVIAYQVGGVGESIAHGETGFILPFEDAKGLAGAVCKLIADPKLRKEMGEAGYRRVDQSFRVEMTVNSIREVICQVLEQRA